MEDLLYNYLIINNKGKGFFGTINSNIIYSVDNSEEIKIILDRYNYKLKFKESFAKLHEYDSRTTHYMLRNK